MKWVTRAGCHVDRTATAWLIRRYIDPEATFTFIADADQVPADATPFDIAGHRFSHHNGDCTFEIMLRDHGLTEPALHRLARIVHEADIEDERYDAPEAPGLDAIVRGMGDMFDDDALLAATAQIYDGLLMRFQADRPA